MPIKSHHILTFFLFAFALTALSACNVSTDSGGEPAFTNICDPDTQFCDSTGALIADCNNITHDCTTGLARPTYVIDIPTDPTIGNYLPSIYEAPPNGGWVAALDTARSDEYDEAGGGADRIGAAYAHARGYTGAGVIVSMITRPIDSTHADLPDSQRIKGYGFTLVSSTVTANTSETAGTCAGLACNGRIPSTHIAGIIAGKSGNGDNTEPTIQGIAYNAKIKPINIYAGTVVASDSRALAVAEASGSNIAVMYSDWVAFDIAGTFSQVTTDMAIPMDDYRYQALRKFTALSGGTDKLFAAEIMAWEKAAEETVIVFAHGDQGSNSETGTVRLYSSTTLTDANYVGDVAWETVEKVGDSSAPVRNLGGSHTTLPTIAPGMHRQNPIGSCAG